MEELVSREGDGGSGIGGQPRVAGGRGDWQRTAVMLGVYSGGSWGR